MSFNPLVPTTAQLRAHEKSWIESCHPQWGLVLMELAGYQAANVVLDLWRQLSGLVVVLCGPGNNGGDGLVIARHLQRASIPVAVHIVEGGKTRKDGEAAVNLSIAKDIALPISKIKPEGLAKVRDDLARASLVVDALLGTGLDRPVEGIYKDVISMMNECGKPVVAVDVPSGLDSDTGQVMGTTVRAFTTVAFGCLKPGLLAYPGAELAGRLICADIGLPNLDYHKLNTEGAPPMVLMTAGFVRANLPRRCADSHKGTYGCLLTVAGSAGMSGAALMCSLSALRSGVGLSLLATPKSLVTELPPQEVIYLGLEETPERTISKKAMKTLEAEMERADAVALGPGLTGNADTVEFVHQFLKDTGKPCIVDADGLNAISANTACIPADAQNLVFTPHPKELSRLIGVSVGEIQSNRYKYAGETAQKFGLTLLLKGSRTVVAGKDGQIFINSTGNHGMSTAGAGDVLSGIIGALLAQKVAPFEAAALGAYIHGAAGDIAASKAGATGMLARNISEALPESLAKIADGQYQGSFLEQQLAARN